MNNIEYRAVIKPKSDDVIEHRSHKYIKKEMVNGKWRYYYKAGSWNNGNGTTTSWHRIDLSKKSADYPIDRPYDTRKTTYTRNPDGSLRTDYSFDKTYGRDAIIPLAVENVQQAYYERRNKTAAAIKNGKATVERIMKKLKKR